jgi:hypothetical protein
MSGGRPAGATCLFTLELARFGIKLVAMRQKLRACCDKQGLTRLFDRNTVLVRLFSLW